MRGSTFGGVIEDDVKGKSLNLTSLTLQIDFHYITWIRNMFIDFRFQPKLSEGDQIFPHTWINKKTGPNIQNRGIQDLEHLAMKVNDAEMRNKQGGPFVCHSSCLKRAFWLRVERNRDRVQPPHWVKEVQVELGTAWWLESCTGWEPERCAQDVLSIQSGTDQYVACGKTTNPEMTQMTEWVWRTLKQL